MLKKTFGITRNKFEIFQKGRSATIRRKNRFKLAGKQEEQLLQSKRFDNQDHQSSGHANSLLSATTQNSAGSIESSEQNQSQQIYDEAKDHLSKVIELRKRMAADIKLRLISFKESQTKIYDDNICKYSHLAVDHILKSEKLLGKIKKISGSSDIQEKCYRNMERSLAQQIRQSSKGLRTQEKQYFDRLKAYQKGTANSAIQLNEEERMKFRGGDDFQTIEVQEQTEEQSERNRQINELIKSINQLSSVYKELNAMVIEQNSLIDRIDYSIEETFTHMINANEHLKSAEKKVQRTCAQKCMYILIVLVLIMAIVLGFKLAK